MATTTSDARVRENEPHAPDDAPASAGPPVGRRERSPIFVVGHGRSGTTLLAAILDAHPALACGPETAFFDLVGKARWRRVLRDPAWPSEATRLLESMERQEGGSVLSAYGVHPDTVRLELASRPRSLGSMMDAVLVPFAESRGARRWVEKTPRHLLRVRTIRQLWPDACIVRIVRDPRDVVASFLRVPFGPTSATGAAYLWRLADDASHRFFEQDRRSITVRYEDLVADPESQIRRLCEFLDEPFDARLLSPGEHASGLVAGDEWWKQGVTGPIDASRSGTWREALSEPDQRRVATICADGMRRYGYDGGRVPARTARLRPLDTSLLEHGRDTLEDATDRGVVFGEAATWRDGARRERLVLWGAPGELRWRHGGRRSTARSVLGWTRVLVSARVRGRPVLWVAEPTGRARHRSAGERVGDTVVRSLARRVTTDALLEELAPPG